MKEWVGDWWSGPLPPRICREEVEMFTSSWWKSSAAKVLFLTVPPLVALFLLCGLTAAALWYQTLKEPEVSRAEEAPPALEQKKPIPPAPKRATVFGYYADARSEDGHTIVILCSEPVRMGHVPVGKSHQHVQGQVGANYLHFPEGGEPP
jgi:hypothetical protein